jgi:hypothetical protein
LTGRTKAEKESESEMQITVQHIILFLLLKGDPTIFKTYFILMCIVDLYFTENWITDVQAHTLNQLAQI